MNKWDVRSSKLDLCIYYVIPLPTKLCSWKKLVISHGIINERGLKFPFATGITVAT